MWIHRKTYRFHVFDEALRTLCKRRKQKHEKQKQKYARLKNQVTLSNLLFPHFFGHKRELWPRYSTLSSVNVTLVLFIYFRFWFSFSLASFWKFSRIFLIRKNSSWSYFSLSGNVVVIGQEVRFLIHSSLHICIYYIYTQKYSVLTVLFFFFPWNWGSQLK